MRTLPLLIIENRSSAIALLPRFSVTRLTDNAFPAKRVSQQPLQGFHLAVSAFVLPLRYALGAFALHGDIGSSRYCPIPRSRVRTQSAQTCVVICNSLIKRLIKLSRKERPSGSLPTFAWDDVALQLNPYLPHYRAAFAFSTFSLYPHRQRHPLRFACPKGQRYGLTVFRMSNEMG